MKLRVLLPLAGVLLGCALPVCAQSNDVSLGDVARSLRKKKEAPKQTVIDNDNFKQLMDDIQNRKLASGSPLFTFDDVGKDFKVSSPDVTCSLSFNAQNSSLLSDPYIAQDLPDSELAKLDGPASITGDTLQLSLYNGTAWNLKEVTVGLTILRPGESKSAHYGTAKLVPAVASAAKPEDPAEKRSDLTVLYHLKGAAGPMATTVLTETLGVTLSPDQDWHWAIVHAKGVPPPPILPEMPPIEF